MRTLSSRVYAAIAAEFGERRNAALIRGLREDLQVVPDGMTDAAVIAHIAPVIRDAKSLGFAKDETDLLQFVALAFLPKAARQDRFVSDNFQRRLGNTLWSAVERFDFVYKHIVPKALRFGW